MFEVTRVRTMNPISYYFGKVKVLELGVAHFHYMSPEAVRVYSEEVSPIYQILYDRIVTSKISPFIKQEFEQWFLSRKDSLGKSETVSVNRELESMLRRCNLV
jgi:hypothetical protein